VSNEELAEGPVLPSESKSTDTPKGSLTEVEGISEEDRKLITELSSWQGISRDKSTLFNVRYSPSNLSASDPSSDTALERQVNIHPLKAAFPEIDNSIEDPLGLWIKLASQSPSAEDPAPHPRKILNIVDGSVAGALRKKLKFADGRVLMQEDLLPSLENSHQIHTVVRHPKTGTPLSLLRVQEGDRCPRCLGGHLKVHEAIELGHTFHLGSRYTKQLDGHVTIPDEIIKDHETDFEMSTRAKTSSSDSQVLVQMGCHGIGVSRMIGAVADTLADEKGLNWPRVMAPFEAVIVPNKGLDDAALEVYDTISKAQHSFNESAIDIVLDDRTTKMLPWKLNDADLIGYPVIVVVGRKWKTEKKCEVQCRRLKIKEDVPLEELPTFIRSVLKSL
jgi:prolyl-tRNA synthetase